MLTQNESTGVKDIYGSPKGKMTKTKSEKEERKVYLYNFISYSSQYHLFENTEMYFLSSKSKEILRRKTIICNIDFR